ncbi:unnamed protein product [Polarella glacialis]|uniref:Uncharacterized protein n=1 Tax=Polarella glacialis TaxID=89957 RepID=A0A813JGB2_POLGL|nr:unnamed protein product [Polarella glacialis]CAE8674362.1 unnamed protein product [Polarella glacialis]
MRAVAILAQAILVQLSGPTRRDIPPRQLTSATEGRAPLHGTTEEADPSPHCSVRAIFGSVAAVAVALAVTVVALSWAHAPVDNAQGTLGSGSDCMHVKDFRIKNNCDFYIEVEQFGQEDSSVHGSNSYKLGWLTVKAGDTARGLKRPAAEGDMTFRGARGCDPRPDGSLPPGCYKTNHLEWRKVGFVGLPDGVEIAAQFLGAGSDLCGVPNLCVWYGYSMSHSLIAYQPGKSQVACSDAGAAFAAKDDLSECSTSGGSQNSISAKDCEYWEGVPGARKPGLGCVTPQCTWPDPSWAQGGVIDCNGKSVPFLKSSSWCVNNLGDGSAHGSNNECLCPKGKENSQGWYGITGYWSEESHPNNTQKTNPCWYPGSNDHDNLVKYCDSGTKKQGGLGFLFDCWENRMDIDLELSICEVRVPANSESSPCPNSCDAQKCPR